jgi:hypothetical protein
VRRAGGIDEDIYFLLCFSASVYHSNHPPGPLQGKVGDNLLSRDLTSCLTTSIHHARCATSPTRNRCLCVSSLPADKDLRATSSRPSPRPVRMHDAPSAAKHLAMAAPMPRLAPVMRQVLPTRDIVFFCDSVLQIDFPACRGVALKDVKLTSTCKATFNVCMVCTLFSLVPELPKICARGNHKPA